MTADSKISTVPPRRKSGSRLGLIAGFGALIILMLFIGVDSMRMVRAFQANNNEIREDFLYRQHTLDQVRDGLYESANRMTDYFLVEGDAHGQQELQNDIRRIQAETTAALGGAIPTGPEPFRILANEMEGYWSAIDSVLNQAGKEKTNSASLRRVVLQQHAKVLSITKELSALNEEELREAERRIDEASTQFRRRILTIGAVGLSFGLVLAAGTIAYAGRLENHLEEKYEESLKVQDELRELSKRLVDTEERERRVISRELHDQIGQSLSALLLDVQNAMEISNGERMVRGGLEKVKASAENCLDEVRNMALLLRPSMLDDLGLVAALEWQAREASKRTGMIIDVVDENVSDNLPEEHRICVYRIVQEALNNCAKHADAKSVRIEVRQEQNHLKAIIEDDGKGFEPRRTRGLGLVGMNERVTQLGGVLTVNSSPGRGTRIEVDLPLPATEANGEAGA